MNRFFISCLVASMLLFAQSPAVADKNEPDVDFIARMNKQAEEMYASANKLDARLDAVDRKSDGKKKRDNLRHELNRIKANIREEQKRLDAKEFRKGQSRKEMQARMQKLQQRLRELETDLHVLGY
jgi:peptidoglycan hydrolase CwlO-like protein